jgi:hypothetical protein
MMETHRGQEDHGCSVGFGHRIAPFRLSEVSLAQVMGVLPGFETLLSRTPPPSSRCMLETWS